MRQGLTSRATVATRRANQQRTGASTATRSTSTQTQAAMDDPSKEKPIEPWDNDYFIDVSELDQIGMLAFDFSCGEYNKSQLEEFLTSTTAYV
jgi:hypothetical protein